MKLKLLAIAVMILSLNLGSNTVQAEQPPVKVQVVAKTNHQPITYLNAKQIKIQAKRDKLKRVVQYLTTRVHKTAYVFSGSTISGWDCSGMVRYAYKRMGITLEHSADKQAHAGTRVSKPRVGDIVVFAYKGSTNFYHSAIYVGEGLIVHANLLYKTTVIQPLSDFKNSQIRFVRVIK
jgi:cell wall-associated NlpC family hydrolase